MEFLTLPTREGFFGGGAGGGKTDALLMAGAQFVHRKEYRAILFRRRLKDHKIAKGLIPRSKTWWLGKARWNGSDYEWTFPSGAKVAFGYLDHEDDHFNYQGGEYHLIGFDELPQFREYQVRWLFSRLRRVKGEDPIPLRILGTGNPDGPMVVWVKRRYVDNPYKPFIPALAKDNPYLDQDEYEESLAMLDPVTRARLRDGDWNIREPGQMFNRTWYEILKVAPAEMIAVRYWDKAVTTYQKRTADPDYAAGVLMATPGNGYFYVLDVHHTRGTPKQIEDLIKQTAQLDVQRGFRWFVTYLEQEPGSSGIEVIDRYRRNVLAGFAFKEDKVTGPKPVRAAAFSTTSEARNVFLVLDHPGAWDVDGYLDELEAFPAGDHDDRVDASSGAFNMLTQNMGRVPNARHA